jgi:hypothetical protein
MDWNPSFSYATLPPGSNNVPSYWITLTTKVPEQQGLPHFSDIHIWNIKATGATQAFEVKAYPIATLDLFRLDHLDMEAKTACLSPTRRTGHFQTTKSRPPMAAKRVLPTRRIPIQGMFPTANLSSP